MVSGLARTAAINYDREVSGEEPVALKLNRVFLGNPGTGKTTVGRLYGRVLKALGLLSKGAWELKLPGDLVGTHVGESEKMTASLVSRSMGKVLFLDEAYGLNNTSYGKAAIDTLVGLVSGEPGEDIAVVMAGYEKQINKMFRECNEGLSSRFDLKNAFRFEDFADADLERVILKEVRCEMQHCLSAFRFCFYLFRFVNGKCEG
ncbi:hypothetical protein B484DRAFT_325843 [Ochromonadaceae sp. CCMP2298]|nr:hypothetical protein B484DRAFT_325843 [Ochromonadaceae sp. CCMP2298]